MSLQTEDCSPTEAFSSNRIAHNATKVTHAKRAYQKLQRRRETLFKKAFEYSNQCDADIQLVVRMKKTGQIFALTSKSKGWPLSAEQLVCQPHQHFPKHTYRPLTEKAHKPPSTSSKNDG
jgi:hypothetical protein